MAVLVEGLSAVTWVALVGGLFAGTLAALATLTWLATPFSRATILAAIDLPSGTIIASLDLGLPLWVRASPTTTAATRGYGRRGDGAGGMSATECGRRSITYHARSPA